MRLALSLTALFLGPSLYHLAQKRRVTLWTLHAMVVVTILALVLLEILPECVELAGWTALLAATAGLLGPVLAERRARAGGLTLWLALSALALHAFTDGMALSGDGHPHAHEGLWLAVTLHRLPEGAALWWLTRPLGARAATTTLLLVGAATALGASVGEIAIPNLGAVTIALFQAFVGGVMLHVLSHAQARHAH
jgi:hypothetical protein